MNGQSMVLATQMIKIIILQQLLTFTSNTIPLLLLLQKELLQAIANLIQYQLFNQP